MYTVYIIFPPSCLPSPVSIRACINDKNVQVNPANPPQKKSNATMRCACGPVDYVATAGQGRGQARVARLVQVATCVQRSSEAEAEAVANCHSRRQLAS